MKKVATFSRTSTELQHTSIENQSNIFDEWIRKNEYILYKNYVDEGISGTKAYKRVQWLQMLEDSKNKKFDILLCKSFSRFGRNQIETLSAIKKLRENGIRVVFIEESLDSEQDSNKFGLFGWLAEQESQNTSKRIKTVFNNFKQVGKIYNCIAPYGYDYDLNKKNFVVNELEAPIVKRIFGLYIKGNGTSRISTILRDEGVPSKNGGVWRANTIKNIILNEAYLGVLVQNKSTNIDVTIKKTKQIDKSEWVRHYNNHEPIIDKETFIKAQNIYELNSDRALKVRNSIAGVNRTSYKSLFSNIVICGDCGSAMTIRRKKNRKPFYNCIAYEREGVSCGHQSNFIQEEFLVEYIREMLNAFIEDNFQDIHIVNRNDIRKSLEDELEGAKKQIDKQVVLSNNLLKLYSENVITIEQFQLQNESISKTLKILIANKDIIESKLKGMGEDNTTNFKKDVESIIKLPMEQWSNQMLKEIIESIVVNTNGFIKINWKLEKY